jgi:hypothetical protein
MTTLCEIVAETIEHLDKCRADDSISKWDTCEDTRKRLCLIMSKLVVYPITSNFTIPVLAYNTPFSDNDDTQACSKWFES